jgi:hypothetical protein
MTSHTEALPEGTHPAPERRKAGLASLVFGLAVPPLAWCAQSVVGYGIASHACFPGDSPLPEPTFSYLRPMLWAFNAAALVSAIVGLWIAARNWSATRRERGGNSTRLIELGEGRTRFLAMCGMLAGAGFVVAILFSSVSLLLSPLCR